MARSMKQRVVAALKVARPFVFVILIVFSFRSSIADWNDVPTGSMNPTILEGDRIFVNKLAYDLKVPFTTWHLAEWDNPKRGDVVVFFSPQDGVRLVKRVIGVPGDRVEVKDNRLHVNGKAAEYEPLDNGIVAQVAGRVREGDAWRFDFRAESIDGGRHPVINRRDIADRDQPPVIVPEGNYFLMGDNRDNSNDSRSYGPVPRAQIVGRASSVVLSLDPERKYKPRWDRFFHPLP